VEGVTMVKKIVLLVTIFFLTFYSSINEPDFERFFYKSMMKGYEKAKIIKVDKYAKGNVVIYSTMGEKKIKNYHIGYARLENSHWKWINNGGIHWGVPWSTMTTDKLNIYYGTFLNSESIDIFIGEKKANEIAVNQNYTIWHYVDFEFKKHLPISSIDQNNNKKRLQP
jgi:hypothetical protein